ncbi:unnamed protein product [Calicophoron daubneyi]|uniref:Uncharacterized protein n=1 Tax=Calicophoron daubneyi TaxID=300641 RepID=A0AAV2T5W8_CALDB
MKCWCEGNIMRFPTSFIIITGLLGLVLAQDGDERSDIFCPDLVPGKLSLEEILNILYLFGSQWDTLEFLMSKNTSEVFHDVIDNPDLFRSEAIVVPSVYRKLVVMKFLDLLNATDGTSEDYLTVEDKYFLHYENGQYSKYTNRTKKLFYATCVVICWNIFNEGFEEAERDRRLALHCPTPCKNACGGLLCLSEGIFQHQYRCVCQKGYEWDVELHTCVSEELKKLREGVRFLLACTRMPTSKQKQHFLK